jgi:hypothetical protein
VQTVAGGGALTVTVSATPLNTQQNNSLSVLRFADPADGGGNVRNAEVTINGQRHTGSFTYTVPPATHELTFTVRRATAGQATTVPFAVVDGCGTWKTFVGGGTGAGF